MLRILRSAEHPKRRVNNCARLPLNLNVRTLNLHSQLALRATNFRHGLRLVPFRPPVAIYSRRYFPLWLVGARIMFFFPEEIPLDPPTALFLKLISKVCPFPTPLSGGIVKILSPPLPTLPTPTWPQQETSE